MIYQTLKPCVLVAAVLTASHAGAASLDLTGATASGTINNAFFIRTDAQGTGSGVLDSFVRLQDNANVIAGYNADARPVMSQVNNSGSFTHDVVLSSVTVSNLGGINYYQFFLDINQNNSAPLLSLDKLQLYTRPTALTSASTLSDLTAGSSVLRYNLDAGTDSEILLNYSLNSGSGSGDLLAYIPASLFGASSDYVYLYSQFGGKGGNYVNNGGYEEWAFRESTSSTTVPEPATTALLGLAASSFLLVRRKSA